MPRTPSAAAADDGSHQPRLIDTDGVIEPTRRAELHAPIAGRVQDCSVREGDAVTAGQVLLRIVPSTADGNEQRLTAPTQAIGPGQEALAQHPFP
ncbi:biotin/lipoyl-binding protein [Halochromatium glycolicum]|uniref:HlyD family efflux transporter periplasmic adaptor subunit n=1 Tax=Halochromatium glycolicum TaxID=85075 RepID=UPI0023EE3D67|nr:biotin/lipoyl-binding protein [Halochromatium glycolicum]